MRFVPFALRGSLAIDRLATISLMGIFKTSEPATWADRARAVPPERSTWIVAVGDVGINAKKGADSIDATVAEIESAGWILVGLSPTVTVNLGKQLQNGMIGHFRRVGASA